MDILLDKSHILSSKLRSTNVKDKISPNYEKYKLKGFLRAKSS